MNNLLHKLWAEKEKNTVILDSSGNIVYSSRVCSCEPEKIRDKAKLMPDGIDETEFFDLNVRIYKSIITDGGEEYICCTFDDISEYTSLVKEISEYTKTLSDVAQFQGSIMKCLKMPYDTILPGLGEYCGSRNAMMVMRSEQGMTVSRYDGSFTRERVADEAQYEKYLSMKTADMLGNYCCIASSETDGSKFSVLIDTTDMTSKNNYAEASIHNVILLFVENSIMRDEIIYENEHDKLTGLYNKAKYIALKKENFGDPGTICIYNFDVNNLKYINDHFGHEFGGKLIVKAAKSIAAVSSDKVLGFRMGGDEFVMIAIGLSEEQSEQLRDKWRAALGELNKDEDGLFISMACGMAFGRGDYDYDELYAEADSLMYENKKELKANGLCSHIIGVE